MNVSALGPAEAPAGDSIGQPKNAAEAAQQFEALLLAQMLRTANSSDSSFDSEQADASKETMWDMAAQQFAQVLSKNGGLGLARMISVSLSPPTPPKVAAPAPSSSPGSDK